MVSFCRRPLAIASAVADCLRLRLPPTDRIQTNPKRKREGGIGWADKTRASAELKTHPHFLSEGRKTDGRKMADCFRTKGTFFCHQFFCQSGFAAMILSLQG
jgi:hypothetical protein